MVIPAKTLCIGPISASAPAALYRQIIDAVKREISAGRLAPGSSLPSFRALAEELLVSLITVKRAYEGLEREGIIYRRQGLGTFIAELGHDRNRAARRAVALDAITAAVRAGREAGLSERELLHSMRAELKQATPIEEYHKESA